VKTLGRRLSRLEERDRHPQHHVIQVLWHDDFVPCSVHTGCAVEVASDRHHQRLIRLSFDRPERG
jgi:hypothetical protein